MRDRGIEGDDRVGQDKKVGTATRSIYRVRFTWISVIKSRSRCCGEMTSGGKPHDADSIQCDAELRRSRAHWTDGSLNIP
jgi:hypothetical protein